MARTKKNEMVKPLHPIVSMRLWMRENHVTDATFAVPWDNNGEAGVTSLTVRIGTDKVEETDEEEDYDDEEGNY